MTRRCAAPVLDDAPMRAAATSALTFTLAVAPVASGCYASHLRPDDAGVDAADVDAGECSAGDTAVATDTVVARVRAADACFNGYVQLDPPTASFYASASLGGTYGPIQLTPCPVDSTIARERAMQARVEAAVESGLPRCAPPSVNVSDGGAQSDLTRMANALTGCATDLWSGGPIAVVLDASGAVSTVRTSPPGAPVADCVFTVLAGLTFPCLASFEVCPEYVIAE